MRKGLQGTGVARRVKSVFVDSSAWFALFEMREARHAEAERLFEELASRDVALLTTNLVVAEIHRLLLFRVGIATAIRTVERLGALERLVIEFPKRPHHDAACDWLRKLRDQRITYADAMSFAVMTSARCDTAFSYDQDFSVAGFTLWQHVV